MDSNLPLSSKKKKRKENVQSIYTVSLNIRYRNLASHSLIKRVKNPTKTNAEKIKTGIT